MKARKALRLFLPFEDRAVGLGLSPVILNYVSDRKYDHIVNSHMTSLNQTQSQCVYPIPVKDAVMFFWKYITITPAL